MSIKLKLKLCSGCGLPKQIWKNKPGGVKLCRDCNGRLGTGVARKSKPTPAQRIPTRSSKKTKLDALYSVLREKFLKKHPMCQAHLYGCTNFSTEVHHSRGRGEYYLDESTFKALCRKCHDTIENSPNLAKELGFSQSRLSNEETT